MAITVTGTDDVAQALAEARAFLETRPAEHNLVHTLLDDRAREPRPGRYWLVRDDRRVVAAAFLSPLEFFTTLTPAPDAVVDALVEVMAGEAPRVSGVNGDAGTAARFAGTWGAKVRVPVAPAEAQRLYRLGSLVAPEGVRGVLREARRDELGLLTTWAAGFNADTGTAQPRADDEVHTHLLSILDESRLFVWDDAGPRSMAWLSRTVGVTARVQHVYTPPDARRNGYASACVAAISAHAPIKGATECVLYTQLSNPTSNAIYRVIGYEPVSEILRYRFGDS